MNDLLTREIVYKAETINQVNITKDLCYADIDSEQLLMDVYTPQGVAESVKLPTVILIHGESSKCNSMKDTGQYVSLGKLIAGSGLIAVTFNHGMLLQGARVSKIHQHIGALLTYIHAHAASLNIDENRIAIWSISAGVPFGLYISTHSATISAKCAIFYYGFCDLASVADFFGLAMPDQDKEEYCPSVALTSGSIKSDIPPMFVARAGLDHTIINKSLDGYITKALLNNLPIDIYNHPDGQHAFDLLDDNKRTHEIIKKTIGFLKLHLQA